MLFKNKDQSKGYHQRFLVWALVTHGLTLTVPDINTVRFGCNTEGARFALKHRELIIEFLEIVRDTKTSPGFNNAEKNTHLGLHDAPTLTELAGLAFVGECFSVSYLQQVRAPDVNHLSLGPLHERAAVWLRTVIAKPQLVTAPYSESLHLGGSFDSRPFRDPAMFASVHALLASGLLVHLDHITAAAFKGVLKTLGNFTGEFSADGQIARASRVSPDLLQTVFVPATNDVNESKVGALRNGLNRAGNARLSFLSAIQMYKTNGTRGYVRKMGRSSKIFLMRETVRREKDHSEKRANLEKAAHEKRQLGRAREKQTRASERRARRDAGLAGTEETRWRSAEDLPALDAKDKSLTVERLKSELRWHKERGNREAWPKGAKLSGTKAVLYAWLKEILEFEDARSATQDSIDETQDSTKNTLDSLDNDVDDLEDEEQEELYYS
ncbi:hypothetical protein EXIGLDRAFT_771924 [Exidia glandulosa HHB12029]|uniref:Uncharacterized protein n=1 Tax=Exidia glandulosa HHB12029 TaxID=1314781 RepID=A0A165FNP7_EXIGL|nr:hypothetical protein EXIGLDRAFT_771924 [Exidia glandulosa HHB12029]